MRLHWLGRERRLCLRDAEYETRDRERPTCAAAHVGDQRHLGRSGDLDVVLIRRSQRFVEAVRDQAIAVLDGPDVI